jgi:poly(A) polymerase
MIRVIRHAARTGFFIEDPSYRAIIEHRDEIHKCSPSRVRDEFLRDLKEGVAQPALRLMLETDLLLSLFPDLERVFGHRNPFREKHRQLFLSLFGLVDRFTHTGKPLPESVVAALFLIPYLRVVIHEHPFLGRRERNHYSAETIRWAVHQIFDPFSLPRASREMASQILVAQSYLRTALERGGIPRRLAAKGYFREAVLLFGIEAEAKGEKVPVPLRNAVPADLLPWWPKEVQKRRRRFRRRKHSRHAVS